MTNTCIFSGCRRYRYTLWRHWPQMVIHEMTSRGGENHEGEYLMVIGLNPSTADETQDDPTIRRCIDFAKRWGYGALCMTNLFAWRATKPEHMKAAADPVGEDNNGHLHNIAEGAGLILAAWGNHGRFMERDKSVQAIIRATGKELHCLGRNDNGTPKHPLYILSDTTPMAYP